jgi:hypothetical protein
LMEPESQNATKNGINMGSGSRLLSHCFAVPQQCITDLAQQIASIRTYHILRMLIFYCCGIRSFDR